MTEEIRIPAPPTEPRRRKLTVLLPAKNEERGLAATLAALPLHELDAMDLDVEILIVDGHSSDRTAAVAKAWGARVILQEGRGKGMAVRSAMRALDGDYVVMIDSDHTYPEEAIPAFVRRLQLGADVVMGSRFLGTIQPGAMGRVNRVGNRLLSFLASVLYRRRVSDLCTGMWAFRRRALQRLPLRSRRFEVEAEIFALSVKSGLRIVEAPISYRPRIGETKLGKLRDGLQIGLMLLAVLPRRVVRARTRPPPTTPRREQPELPG